MDTIIVVGAVTAIAGGCWLLVAKVSACEKFESWQPALDLFSEVGTRSGSAKHSKAYLVASCTLKGTFLFWPATTVCGCQVGPPLGSEDVESQHQTSCMGPQ